MRSTCAVALLVAAVVLLAPLASAEHLSAQAAQACLAPLIELPSPPERFEPGTSRTMDVIVRNPNAVPGQARLAAPTLPERWTAIVSEASREVAPNGEALFRVTVTSPPRGAGAEQGALRFTATVACQTEPFPTESPVGVKEITVQMAAFSITWVIAGIAVAAAGVAGIVALVLLGRRRSVKVHAEERQKPIPRGGSATFTLTVENRSANPARFRIALRGIPLGWEGFLAAEELELDAGSAQEIWASLRAPAGAREGEEVRVSLIAYRDGVARDRATLTFRAKVGPVPAPAETREATGLQA